ncbi:hypothetical protein [Cyclobacterium plantarum]|uniref:GH18 domain-containing protein n=1 Tax=Cyclobacterium plantarum TaxID=2716263 RepID=A0ABX0HHU0_9BACT|nr:hypothetical protein [Cyclobacterium plantarum]NHE59883.1 hypothetical protein [Cyclobacterium plantarum]
MLIRLIITIIGFFSCSIAPMEVMDSDPDFKVLYYNSQELIKRKTALTKARGLGGVMVWHVQADSPDEFSLLAAIKEELQ